MLPPSLVKVLTEPTAAALWALRGELLVLADRMPAPDRAQVDWSLEVVADFHRHVAEGESKRAARAYSEKGTKMELASLGILAVEDLIGDREGVFRKLFLGGLSEGLGVSAAQQHVRAWATESSTVDAQAAWWLFGALWRLSRQLRPEIDPTERRGQIDALLAPLRGHELSDEVRSAFLAELYQAVLVSSLAWLTQGASPSPSGGARE